MRTPNVLLVYPPFYNEAVHNVPPLGILKLASYLLENGLRVTLKDYVFDLHAGKFELDSLLLDTLAKDICESQPDVVGFSTQATTLPSSIGIADRIKAIDSKIQIVFGGYGSSFCSELILEVFPSVDVIVIGEGEVTFLELIQAYSKGGSLEPIEGLVYRNNNADRICTTPQRKLIENLDDLPFPAYNLLPSPSEYARVNRNRQQKNRPFPVDSGRGCTFTCNFCSSCLMFNHKVRSRSPQSIIEEIKFLHIENGIKHFLLTYDIFNINKRKAQEFCEALAESNLDIIWECRCRLDLLTPELTRNMYLAGCRNVLIGVESGSKVVLGQIRKRLKILDLKDRIKMVIDQGIVPIFSFVIGFPNEKPTDVSDTLRLSLFCRMHEGASTTFHMATPLPGTDLYQESKSLLELSYMTGDLSSGIEFDDDCILEEDRRRIANHPEIFCSFYNIKCRYLDIADVFFVYRVWNVVVGYYPRTLTVLDRDGLLDFWGMMASFNRYCPPELHENLHKVGRAREYRRICENFSQFINDNYLTGHSSKTSSLLSNVLRFEDMTNSILGRELLSHQENEAIDDTVFRLTILKVNPSARFDVFRNSMRKEALMGGDDEYHHVAIVVLRQNEGWSHFEVPEEYLNVLNVFSKPICTNDALKILRESLSIDLEGLISITKDLLSNKVLVVQK